MAEVRYNEDEEGMYVDKARIGRFLAVCRRARQMTQEQLAEALGVTGKSVSKWETGKCLPDADLYEPLCGALGISIGEMFAAQRFADDDLLRMLKKRLYEMSDKSISFDEFSGALSRMAEVSALLRAFDTKAEAVRFLMEETHTSEKECADAYDFYMNMFYGKEKTDL